MEGRKMIYLCLAHMSEDVLVKAYFKDDMSAQETLLLVREKLADIARIDMGFDMFKDGCCLLSLLSVMFRSSLSAVYFIHCLSDNIITEHDYILSQFT